MGTTWIHKYFFQANGVPANVEKVEVSMQMWEPLEFTNLFSGKVGNHLNSQISFNADVGTTWIREAQPVSCPTAHQQTSNPIVDRQLQVNRKREAI